jgi:hypothetical protein
MYMERNAVGQGVYLAVLPDVLLLAAASASDVRDLRYEYSEIIARGPDPRLGQVVMDFEP